jgi:hypothetical protein
MDTFMASWLPNARALGGEAATVGAYGTIAAPLTPHVRPCTSKLTEMSAHTGATIVSYRAEATRAGISFGSALAIAISWSVHHSILWAIIQGFCSWLYVIYYALTRTR